MKNIFSIIIIVASLIVFVIIVKPEYIKIQETEARSKELGEVLTNARKLQSLRDGLLDKQSKLSGSDIKRLEKLIPESADNVNLIIEFQNIADKYNLKIETASSQKDDEKDSKQSFDIDSRDYGIISIDFSITGSYNDFVSFLSEIEDSLRITDIRSLSIASNDLGGYQFTMTVETYWLKDNI